MSNLSKHVRVQLTCALSLALLMFGSSARVYALGKPPRVSSRATPSCEGQPATIIGTEGADSIDGTAGDDVIVGLVGDDVLRGLGGDDLICGGPGEDIVHGGAGSDGVVGEGGNDVLRCGPGHDGGADGGPGNDILYGEKGGRTDLTPGLGDDLVVGSGTGADWVHLEDATGSIHANLMTGVATGQGRDRLVDVSGLFAGPYDDTLIGDNNGNQLAGRAGDDILIGHDGVDFLAGQQDDDTYQGGPGFDIAEYYDQAAADELVIGPMNVNLRTGIATGDGTDTLTGIEGATGSDKADTMIGDRKGNAFFWLFDGDDTVRGGGGNDYVAPGDGANTLSGGEGRDLVSFQEGKDFDHDHEAVTVDLVTGVSSSGDALRGFEDASGSPGGDTLIGDYGPNRLYGGFGADVLRGRPGDDRLLGQQGVDEANGGAGIDRCHAETISYCESGVSRGDRVQSWPSPGAISWRWAHRD